jgi:hypothetical protein
VKWVDNIETDLEERGRECADLIELARECSNDRLCEHGNEASESVTGGKNSN